MDLDSALPTGIDYAERWRRLVRARIDQGRRLDREHNRPDHWAGDRAARMSQLADAAARAAAPDQFLKLVRTSISPRSTVLDVGAGAGRYVIPLAREVAHVVAVEPSPSMRAQLETSVRRAGLSNVSIVAAAWPDAKVEPADVVLCSHVVYFVEEISPFLEALRDVTLQRLYVVVRHEQRERYVMPLFEQVWREPRRFEPTFVDLFGAACQIKMWGNAATIDFGLPLSFESLDEAVQGFRRDLLNPDGRVAEDLIREYLRVGLVEHDGSWRFVTPPAHAGVFWWDGANKCGS